MPVPENPSSMPGAEGTGNAIGSGTPIGTTVVVVVVVVVLVVDALVVVDVVLVVVDETASGVNVPRVTDSSNGALAPPTEHADATNAATRAKRKTIRFTINSPVEWGLGMPGSTLCPRHREMVRALECSCSYHSS